MGLFDVLFKPRHISKDEVLVKSIKPAGLSPTKIAPLRPVTLSFDQSSYLGRGMFRGAQYDLSEIGKIVDTESLVRQSFKKKLGLMFKEGVAFTGPNKNTVRYIKLRFAQIERATNIPTGELFKRTAEALIRTSNAFWVKVRKSEASGGRIRVGPNGKTYQPIAGYFPIAPETMRFDMDPNTGQIRKWRHELPDGRYKEFNPDDIVHFVIDRREGFVFGVPVIIPVIDDIRALRQIEENIELLLHQNLFPLFHYKVGTETAPAGYTEEGQKEIDIVEQQVRLMPAEGAIVTPERHEITAIGSEGRALRAEGYLQHFQRRVIGGLGISEIDAGIGDTANRGTARSLSRALIDSVKDMQDSLEDQFDHFIISELLLESTLGERVLDEENMVHLQFAEIDIENRIEQEKHFTELWKANGLTWDEYRAALGKEPIIVPEDPNDQDPKKYPEWFNTYWKLFDEPVNLIRAVDEPYSQNAIAAAESRSLGITQQGLQTAQKAKEQEREQDAQTQIRIARERPQAKAKDNFLRQPYQDIQNDTIQRILLRRRAVKNIDWVTIEGTLKTWAEDSLKRLKSRLIAELTVGFNEVARYQPGAENILLPVRDEIDARLAFRFGRLIRAIVATLKKRVDLQVHDELMTMSDDELAARIRTVFDAIAYRIDYLFSVETDKARNYGKVLAGRAQNATIEYHSHSDSCDSCGSAASRAYHAYEITLESVAPHHPNCKCSIRLRLPN